MSKTVQARLDDETQADLKVLVRRLGLSPSEVVRQAVKLLASHEGVARRKFIGLGVFDSGMPDLGSNPQHLRGFGRGR